LNEKNTSKNNKWDPGEEIIFFKPGAKGVGTDTLTWGVVIYKPLDSTVVLLIQQTVMYSLLNKTSVEAVDQYVLKTQAGKVNIETTKSSLDKIYVVPNPYVGMNDIEPTTKLPDNNVVKDEYILKIYQASVQ
jgi:hypothetical protein